MALGNIEKHRKSRTRLSPQARRQQLLTQGVEWLAERPLDAITVEDLAAAVSVSPGLIFYYFSSREGLHQEILAAATTLFLQAIEPDSGLPARQRIHDTMSKSVGFARNHSNLFISIARSVSSSDPAVRVVVEEARTVSANRALTALHELGIPRSPLIDLCIHAWVALVERILLDQAEHCAPGRERAATSERPAINAADVVTVLERSLYAMVDAFTGNGSAYSAEHSAYSAATVLREAESALHAAA